MECSVGSSGGACVDAAVRYTAVSIAGGGGGRKEKQGDSNEIVEII